MAYVHELSGSKLRSTMSSGFNEAVAAPTSSFAKKQLQKMGWEEGDGLGKNLQGMSKHIKVKQRENEIGLGHAKFEKDVQWWNNGMSSILSRLSGGKTKKIATDEELYKATNGKRFGMRAQRKQKGKWARTENISKEDEADAKSKVEWNGQGKAEVILKEVKSKKRKRSDKTEDGDKKKRKKEKKDKMKKEKNNSCEKDKSKDKKLSKKEKKEKKKKKREEKN
eukprot:CAMPEP_0194195412 /NCGR_PEP_ID=MMETSP0154-20130528/76122_1 /TAXON_ID=1049557 /ORGANISM="Thalassiothrix antarctica, Strain L6-D1" /LENGTH=222 /DNA_ID=CAMNT_0038919943 /DNA_START=45 /DNA_END=713 /DNA_ORIENTATION=+